MLNLIVNADDLGISHKVNKEIVRSFKEGILTSASLMANGDAFDDAVKIVKDIAIDVGIHFSLVQGKSVNNSLQISSLINQDDKFFTDSKSFLKNYLLGRISIRDIEKELFSQVERIFDHGISITHLDSHQHLHILPKILDIVNTIAKKYSIKFVRLPKEPIKMYMLKDGYFNTIIQLASINMLCSKVKKKLQKLLTILLDFILAED